MWSHVGGNILGRRAMANRVELEYSEKVRQKTPVWTTCAEPVPSRASGRGPMASVGTGFRVHACLLSLPVPPGTWEKPQQQPPCRPLTGLCKHTCKIQRKMEVFLSDRKAGNW